MPPLDSRDLKYTKVLSGQEALGALHTATNKGSVLKMCLLQNSSFASVSFSRCPAHGEKGCKNKTTSQGSSCHPSRDTPNAFPDLYTFTPSRDYFLSLFNTNSQPRVHRTPGLGTGQGKEGPLAELEASGQAWEKRSPGPQARGRPSRCHPPSDPTWPEPWAPASSARVQGQLSRQLVGSPPAYLLSGLRARLGPAAARRPGLAAPPRPAPRAAPRAARPRRDPRSPRPRKF